MFKRTKELKERKIYELEKEVVELRQCNFQLKKKLEEVTRDEKVCDVYCTGCANLIEEDTYYVRNYRYGYASCSPSPVSQTKKVCALNRKCKDYVAKGDEDDKAIKKD